MPDGVWIDFFTGHRYEGGQKIRVFRPLSGMPVFVRPGTIIPMDGAETLRNGCPLPEKLSFRIFAGAAGSHTLIEDNGRSPISQDYRRCDTCCELLWGENTQILIHAAEGAADILPAGRQITLELVDMPNVMPDEVSCGFSTDYDAGRRTLIIHLDAKPGEAVSLKWEKKPVCPQLDKYTLLYDLLLPVQMDNQVKEHILNLSSRLERAEQRIAAIQCCELPEGLLGALTEIELIR